MTGVPCASRVAVAGIVAAGRAFYKEVRGNLP